MMVGVNYIVWLLYEHVFNSERRSGLVAKEGFVDGADSTKAAQSEQSKYSWLTGDDIYDDFFAGIYDKLVQGEKRSQAEVVTLVAQWKKLSPTQPVNHWRVLDLGCGTGITTVAFARAGVGSVTGVDRSAAMIRRARDVTVAATTLTPAEKVAIHWKNGDIADPMILRQGEYTHACAMYFTVYYMKDKAVFFRNVHGWLKPGGVLTVFVVNKAKFDPMLESAAPTVFSLQKYSDKRIMKSKVVFDKFEYEGEFDIEEERDEAYFRETFRFKDGTVRRQRHDFWMPSLKSIVSTAKAAGWEYRGYLDCTAVGMEYCYMLEFVRL